MGYTTEFKGHFDIAPKLDLDTYQALVTLADGDQKVGPGGYCQWEPTEDGLHLQWDGIEKFYNYVEWLEYTIKNVLAPKGYVLSGSVDWQGEETGDVGTITVKGNVVSSKEWEAPEDRLITARAAWVLVKAEQGKALPRQMTKAELDLDEALREGNR